MFRVGIRESLRARHHLDGDFGAETVTHWHEYRIDWSCDCASLDETGFPVDASALRHAFGEVRVEVEGRLLNDLDFFDVRQPSPEAFAHYLSIELWRRLCEDCEGVEKVVRTEVRVWASETAWASCIDENPELPAKRAKAAAPKRGGATSKRKAPGSRPR